MIGKVQLFPKLILLGLRFLQNPARRWLWGLRPYSRIPSISSLSLQISSIREPM